MKDYVAIATVRSRKKRKTWRQSTSSDQLPSFEVSAKNLAEARRKAAQYYKSVVGRKCVVEPMGPLFKEDSQRHSCIISVHLEEV